MNNVMKTALVWGLFALLNPPIALAQETKTIESVRSAGDFALTADPEAPHWRNVRGVFTERDQRGELVPGHRTEIRSRWTGRNLYLLFICPYEELNLIAKPSTTTETDKLWDWDVAEAFIGTDFSNIKHYTEFQVSPQGEWVDLDIDRSTDPPNHNVGWNSGYKVKARTDPSRKIWYGEMSIPLAKIDQRQAAIGNTMRINFYRIQGPGGSGGAGPRRKHIAWQPTNSPTYHVPESFGTLKLVK